MTAPIASQEHRSQRNRAIWTAATAAMLVALVGGVMTDIGPWYQSLRKPDWQPPDWLFGPAWTLIFTLAAIAGVKSWLRAPTQSDRDWIIILFAANGFLNVLWSLLFFRLKRPDWALIETGFLWLSVIVLIFALARYSKTAAWLLVPYAAWVTFASILNWKIVELNPDKIAAALALI
ncbi:MAG: TspO/MBR family protein [Hyphomicrobiales bacterium]|nr:TspO/MBR family protein [Hyphomicrobiales bacterium]